MNRGKIDTCSLSDLKQINTDQYDVKLFIVRHPGKVMNSISKLGFVHVSDLAPSEKLFKETTREKKVTGDWYRGFEQGYMHEIDPKLPYLDRIEKHLEEGRNVLLCCYCKNERTCHRGMVKNIMEIRRILKNKI